MCVGIFAPGRPPKSCLPRWRARLVGDPSFPISSQGLGAGEDLPEKLWSAAMPVKYYCTGNVLVSPG